MTLAANAAAMIAERGSTMTLQRSGETDISLKGVRQDGGLQEAGNTATQQQFRVRIAPTELQASAWASKVPSADSDTLVVDGRRRTVLDVDPIYDGDTLAMYEITVAG